LADAAIIPANPYGDEDQSLGTPVPYHPSDEDPSLGTPVLFEHSGAKKMQ
jgi:hypothetical protein